MGEGLSMQVRGKSLIAYSVSGIALGALAMLIADSLWIKTIGFVGIIILNALIAAIVDRS